MSTQNTALRSLIEWTHRALSRACVRRASSRLQLRISAGTPGSFKGGNIHDGAKRQAAYQSQRASQR
jgi:hypothetical protein